MSFQVSGQLGKHGPVLTNHVAVVFLFEPEGDRCLWAAFMWSLQFLLTKGITMKRQNGILSAVFDRAGEDGVGVKDGLDEGTELHT